jgi:hypothetical protein
VLLKARQGGQRDHLVWVTLGVASIDLIPTVEIAFAQHDKNNDLVGPDSAAAPTILIVTSGID